MSEFSFSQKPQRQLKKVLSVITGTSIELYQAEFQLRRQAPVFSKQSSLVHKKTSLLIIKKQNRRARKKIGFRHSLLALMETMLGQNGLSGELHVSPVFTCLDGK